MYEERRKLNGYQMIFNNFFIVFPKVKVLCLAALHVLVGFKVAIRRLTDKSLKRVW